MRWFGKSQKTDVEVALLFERELHHDDFSVVGKCANESFCNELKKMKVEVFYLRWKVFEEFKDERKVNVCLGRSVVLMDSRGWVT